MGEAPAPSRLEGARPQVQLPAVPTQSGPAGIRYDFNEGCRIALPPGDWRVRLTDLDTGGVLSDRTVRGGIVASAAKFYVRFGIEIWQSGNPVLRHRFDAAGRDVLARMEVGGLGDQLAWLGHAVAFARQHGARLTCAVRAPMLALLEDAYPAVRFEDAASVDGARFYATYKLFIFYNDDERLWQPVDYREAGLCTTAAYILGQSPVERRPRIVVDPGGPPVGEPYVCIAVQATSQNKYWNNPHGWDQVVAFLKRHGYRVICLDQNRVHGHGTVWNHIPHGAEDETGNRPLTERARWLRHAAFFVGLSSGLSWLAWAAGCPVVMIGGFTQPFNEFFTPFRVLNRHVCNGCANDVQIGLDPGDFLWCPRLAGTDRRFECSRRITAEQVIASMRSIPGFGRTVASGGL